MHRGVVSTYKSKKSNTYKVVEALPVQTVPCTRCSFQCIAILPTEGSSVAFFIVLPIKTL